MSRLSETSRVKAMFKNAQENKRKSEICLFYHKAMEMMGAYDKLTMAVEMKRLKKMRK